MILSVEKRGALFIGVILLLNQFMFVSPDVPNSITMSITSWNTSNGIYQHWQMQQFLISHSFTLMTKMSKVLDISKTIPSEESVYTSKYYGCSLRQEIAWTVRGKERFSEFCFLLSRYKHWIQQTMLWKQNTQSMALYTNINRKALLEYVGRFQGHHKRTNRF